MSICSVLSALLFGLVCARAENKLIVTKVEPSMRGEPDPTGVTYVLPKTAVSIDVTLKRIDIRPGKFAQYTDEFFDLTPKKDYPLEPKTTFTAQNATVGTKQLADGSEQYRVKLTSEWMKDRHFALELAEDGTLGKGEITVTSRRADFFINILGTVASIAGKFVGAAAFSMSSADGGKAACEKLVLDAFESERAVYAPEGAKAAYCDIVLLTEQRLALLKGTSTAVDGVGTLLSEIDVQIKKLFAENFTGSTTEEAWTAQFEHVPTSTSDGPELLTFDDSCGNVVPVAAVWLGTSVPPEFQKLEECKAGQIHTVKVAYAEASNSPHKWFTGQAPTEHSFVFRRPASVNVVVADSASKSEGTNQSSATGDRMVAKSRVAISQLGAKGYMPAVLGGKKSSVTVTLHANGALKSVDIGVEAQGNIAETAGTAATNIIDAELARRKAIKDETDELVVAQRKQQLAEAEVARRRAQCIIDGLCPLNPEQ